MSVWTVQRNTNRKGREENEAKKYHCKKHAFSVHLGLIFRIVTNTKTQSKLPNPTTILGQIRTDNLTLGKHVVDGPKRGT